jgi:hypothetical protein
MSDMMEVAVSWGVWAWLEVWMVDLLYALLIGPLTAIGVVRFLIVAVAATIVTIALFRHRWLWPG